MAVHQFLDYANHLTQAAPKSRQLADNQPVTVFQEIQKFLDPALCWTSARGHLNLYKLINSEVLLPRVLQNSQLLVGKILRPGGNAEVGDSFHGMATKTCKARFL